MKKLGIFTIFYIFLLTLQACKQTNITSEAPDKQQYAIYQRKLSTINIPINFPVKQLENKLNLELNSVLYKDDDLTGDNVKLTITKRNKIIINADGNKLYFTIPIHVWALGNYEWQACSFCPKLAKSESTEFDMNIKFQSMLSVTESWQVKTQTTGGYTWGNQKPKIEIGPLSIPISGIIDLALKPQTDKLLAQMDKEIQNRINIKQYVQKAWTDLQQPILLDKNLSAWLAISPQDIRVTPIQMVADEINMKIGIRSYIEVFTGLKPEIKANNILPKLVTDPALADDFEIGLSAEIPYDYATQMLKKEIIGKNFNLENNKYILQIKDLALSGNGDKILMQADVDGKTNKGKKVTGRIFLEGTPYYDAKTQTIRVRGFDYNLKTKNVLLKSAGWLVNATFLKQIEDKLTFSVKDHITNAQKMVQDGLNENGRISSNIFLKGSINSIEPEGIYLDNNGIKAVVNAKGKVSAIIDKL